MSCGHIAAHPGSVTQQVASDHQRLDAILADAVEMLEDGETERGEDTFREFDEGLLRHLELEETVLFPAFERATGLVPGPTLPLRAEHDEIRVALAQLRSALVVGDLSRFHAALAQLRPILMRHHAKEEQLVYPRADSALPGDERARLVSTLRRR